MRIFIVAGLLAAPVLALAQPVTVDQHAVYRLGDEDSLAQARRYCVTEAERQAVAQSGSLVETNLTSTTAEHPDSQVTSAASQSTHSYNAAIVGSALVSQNLVSVDGKNSLECDVRVTYDPDEIKAKLQDLISSQTLQQKLADQQAQITDLSNRLKPVEVTQVAAPPPPPLAAYGTPPPQSAPPPPQSFAPPPIYTPPAASPAPPVHYAPPPVYAVPAASVQAWAPPPIYQSYAAPPIQRYVVRPAFWPARAVVRYCRGYQWHRGRVRCVVY